MNLETTRNMKRNGKKSRSKTTRAKIKSTEAPSQKFNLEEGAAKTREKMKPRVKRPTTQLK